MQRCGARTKPPAREDTARSAFHQRVNERKARGDGIISTRQASVRSVIGGQPFHNVSKNPGVPWILLVGLGSGVEKAEMMMRRPSGSSAERFRRACVGVADLAVMAVLGERAHALCPTPAGAAPRADIVARGGADSPLTSAASMSAPPPRASVAACARAPGPRGRPFFTGIGRISLVDKR